MTNQSKKLQNKMAQPRIMKVVINAGLGRMIQQPNFVEKILPEIERDLAAITGQKTATAAARKSIAGFKIREGQIIGLKTTLRRKKMKDFLDRLINIVLPRVRDFKGIDLKNIDANGNLSIGLKEQAVFPEINSDVLKFDFGLQISIVNNAKNRDSAIELYRSIGMPLKNPAEHINKFMCSADQGVF